MKAPPASHSLPLGKGRKSKKITLSLWERGDRAAVGEGLKGAISKRLRWPTTCSANANLKAENPYELAPEYEAKSCFIAS